MPTQRRSKWDNRYKHVCHKFEDAVEGTREQTDLFWDGLALPKKIYRPHKKPKNKILAKTQKQRKQEKYAQYKIVCREVDKRDKHTCQFEGCKCKAIEHHHARFRSNGGQDVIEEIVDLCWGHHRGLPESPHQSDYWRRYWEDWLERKYPIHWAKIREGQKIQQNNNKIAIGGR